MPPVSRNSVLVEDRLQKNRQSDYISLSLLEVAWSQHGHLLIEATSLPLPLDRGLCMPPSSPLDVLEGAEGEGEVGRGPSMS